MKLLEILEYYEHYIDLLLEASDYDNMFSPNFVGLLNANLQFKPNIKGTIADAKSKLERKDRIIWFLRVYKLSLLKQLASSPDEQIARVIKKEIVKYNSKSSNKKTIATLQYIPDIYELLVNLQHYLSMGIHSINAFEFKYQEPKVVLNMFSVWEAEHIAKKSSDRLISEKNEEVFLDLGGGWVWFNLNRPYCGEEGDKMGHCGNSPDKLDTNQTILSLRKLVKKDDKTFWQPHATFIYFKRQQKLGQRKGMDNFKPSKEVEPYIVALLKDPRVKGFNKPTSTHHMAQQDFDINDLDDETKQSVFDINDTYMTLKDRIIKNGVTDAIVSDLNHMGDEERNEELKKLPNKLKDLVFEKQPNFMSLRDRIKKFGVNQEVIEGLRGMAIYRRADFIDSLEDKYKKKIFKLEPNFLPLEDKIKKFGITNDVIEELTEMQPWTRDELLINLPKEDADKIFKRDKSFKTLIYEVNTLPASELVENLAKANPENVDKKDLKYPYIIGRFFGVEDVINAVGSDEEKRILKAVQGDVEFTALQHENLERSISNNLTAIQKRAIIDYKNRKYNDANDDDAIFLDWSEILERNNDKFYKRMVELNESSLKRKAKEEFMQLLVEAADTMYHEIYKIKTDIANKDDVWLAEHIVKIDLNSIKIITQEEDIQSYKHLVNELDLIQKDYPFQTEFNESDWRGLVEHDKDYFDAGMKKIINDMEKET